MMRSYVGLKLVGRALAMTAAVLPASAIAASADTVVAATTASPSSIRLATQVHALAVAAPDTFRLDGEYGLAVWRGKDSVTVAWLTREAAVGRLEVRIGDRLVYEVDTLADSAHRATFASPGNAFTLRYGSAADNADVHETVIRKDPGDRKPRVAWSAPDSVVVISDIHGEFDRMIAVLQNAGVVDAGLHWSGGHTNLVVVGDVFDRGEKVTRTLWFLYELEAEAESAGGRLHMVLGNHEIMVMLGDLRYLSPQDSAVARLHGKPFSALFHPSESVIGRWLTSKPGMIRIGDALFAHGGVSTDYLDWKLESWGDTLQAYTHEELFSRWTDTTYAVPMDSATFARRWDFFWGERSVFWYRGYAQSDSLGAELDAVLDRFRAKRLIVGHTPAPTITERYDGRLIVVNTLPFAAEVLLMTRRHDDWDLFRIGQTGPPQPLRAAPPGW